MKANKLIITGSCSKWSIRAKKWSIRAEPIDFYKLICYVTSENVSFMTLKLSFMTCLEKRKLIII